MATYDTSETDELWEELFSLINSSSSSYNWDNFSEMIGSDDFAHTHTTSQILAVTIGTFSFLCNGLLLITSLFVRGRWSTDLRLAVSIACADILLAIGIIIRIFLVDPLPEETSHCLPVAQEAIFSSANLVVVFSLLGMAVDSYIRRVWRERYVMVVRPTRVAFLLAVTWIAAVVLGASDLLVPVRETYLTGCTPKVFPPTLQHWCLQVSCSVYETEYVLLIAVMLLVAVTSLIVLHISIVKVLTMCNKRRQKPTTSVEVTAMDNEAITSEGLSCDENTARSEFDSQRQRLTKSEGHKSRQPLIAQNMWTTLILISLFILLWLLYYVHQGCLLATVHLASSPQATTLLQWVIQYDAYMYVAIAAYCCLTPLVYVFRTELKVVLLKKIKIGTRAKSPERNINTTQLVIMDTSLHEFEHATGPLQSCRRVTV